MARTGKHANGRAATASHHRLIASSLRPACPEPIRHGRTPMDRNAAPLPDVNPFLNGPRRYQQNLRAGCLITPTHRHEWPGKARTPIAQVAATAPSAQRCRQLPIGVPWLPRFRTPLVPGAHGQQGRTIPRHFTPVPGWIGRMPGDGAIDFAPRVFGAFRLGFRRHAARPSFRDPGGIKNEVQMRWAIRRTSAKEAGLVPVPGPQWRNGRRVCTCDPQAVNATAARVCERERPRRR